MDRHPIERHQEHASSNVGISSLRSSMAAPPIVDARALSAYIEDVHILHELSFRVETGRLVGLLGPNGSGKTTLLRCVSGLLPYSGTLEVLGREISTWSPRELARRLAFVRQAVSMSFDFSVSEVILLGRSPHKRWLQDYARDDRDRMVQALEHVDLDGFEDRSVLTLSGGELQRVFLAQALVQEAEVLLLDEPTAHLDVHYQFEFMNLIRELVGHGRTVIAVFHDLEIASRFADDLIVLQRGRVVAGGKPADVLTKGLIADVFRMDASLHASSHGTLRIEYTGPLQNDTTDRSSP
jgi:iron complex transport system ATP-binding protein